MVIVHVPKTWGCGTPSKPPFDGDNEGDPNY